jgi:hypothetical protein
MNDKRKHDEPKQKTREGYEIPVPQRDEFFRNLGKVAKTESATKDRPKQ